MQIITDQEIKQILSDHYSAEIRFAPGELPDVFEIDEIPASTEHLVKEWIRSGEVPEWSTFEVLLYLAREGWIEQGNYWVTLFKKTLTNEC